MKFSLAVSVLALSGVAQAFIPAKAAAKSSFLQSTASDTKTYTFSKSEEIFKEAQDVS